MLLRKSFSNTKKFFQKSLKNFKSFISGGDYEKLPKTPPKNQTSCAVTSTNHIIAQTSFNGDDIEHAKKRNIEKITSSPIGKSKKHDLNGSFMDFTKASPLKSYQIQRKEDHSHCEGIPREVVTEKLKELEMMDLNNVDHVLDVEEILHYYSRLTCPAYVDIVDKFFMQMYPEFMVSHANPQRIISRPMVYSMTAGT